MLGVQSISVYIIIIIKIIVVYLCVRASITGGQQKQFDLEAEDAASPATEH